jgi:hypothetical protein
MFMEARSMPMRGEIEACSSDPAARFRLSRTRMEAVVWSEFTAVCAIAVFGLLGSLLLALLTPTFGPLDIAVMPLL